MIRYSEDLARNMKLVQGRCNNVMWNVRCLLVCVVLSVLLKESTQCETVRALAKYFEGETREDEWESREDEGKSLRFYNKRSVDLNSCDAMNPDNLQAAVISRIPLQARLKLTRTYKSCSAGCVFTSFASRPPKRNYVSTFNAVTRGNALALRLVEPLRVGTVVCARLYYRLRLTDCRTDIALCASIRITVRAVSSNGDSLYREREELSFTIDTIDMDERFVVLPLDILTRLAPSNAFKITMRTSAGALDASRFIHLPGQGDPANDPFLFVIAEVSHVPEPGNGEAVPQSNFGGVRNTLRESHNRESIKKAILNVTGVDFNQPRPGHFTTPVGGFTLLPFTLLPLRPLPPLPTPRTQPRQSTWFLSSEVCC